jgi:hypothetical protein
VAGALTAYDLPDLIGAMAPRKVLLVGLQDAKLEPASEQLIQLEMNFPRAAYASKKASQQLEIKPTTDPIAVMVEACFK